MSIKLKNNKTVKLNSQKTEKKKKMSRRNYCLHKSNMIKKKLILFMLKRTDKQSLNLIKSVLNQKKIS